MTTPRKHWFRVAEELALDDTLDPEIMLTAIRLIAWMNRRRARDELGPEEACAAWIGPREACLIARCDRPHVAFQRLARAPLDAGWKRASVTLEPAQRPTSAFFKWPKLAEYQGWESRTPGNPSPPISRRMPSPTPTPSEEEKEEEEPPPLSDPLWKRLAKGSTITSLEPETVRAWAELKWPALLERQPPYKNLRRALINWWQRVRREEIEQAWELLDARDRLKPPVVNGAPGAKPVQQETFPTLGADP